MNNINQMNNINTFHTDKWQISLSNLPTLSSVKDMYMYDNFVKTFTLPDYTMGEIISNVRGYNIHHPLGGIKMNDSLSPIMIEYKLIENMLNYINMFEYMKAMKYGDTSKFNTEEEYFRKNTVKSINLTMMDNQKRPIAIWRFKDALLTNLSSISLTQGSAEEVTFSTTFSYHEIEYETISINN